MRRPLSRTLALQGLQGAPDALARRARAMPSLDLRFAETKSLTDWISGQDLITFTRASSGTVVNAAGTLETVASNLPRLTHNPLTGESLGLLLEEQRTNLLLNSATLSTQSVTVTAVAHTLSFTGTGTVTLSGVSTAGPLVGTGAGEANRVSLTFTPTAGTLTLTVSGTVTDAQLEAGSSRTTYIPTAGATATRSADLASITGDNFSSWYNQSEGTVFASPSTINAAYTTGVIWDIGAGGAFGSTAYCTWSGTQWTLNPNVSPLNLLSAITAPALSTNASALQSNNSVISASGLIAGVDSSCSMPSNPTTLSIGRAGWTSGNFFNGTIRRLTYWPQRLPNNSLVAITR